MTEDDLERLAREVLDAARSRGLKLATAESCTGGMVAAALTAIAGSSDVFEGAVVSYANQVKQGLLGVDAQVLAREGAVSAPVARAMAEGALETLGADLAVSITGIAGPGGGSADKPVGLVHLATALRGRATRHREARFGDVGRQAVRLASAKLALELLVERLSDDG